MAGPGGRRSSGSSNYSGRYGSDRNHRHRHGMSEGMAIAIFLILFVLVVTGIILQNVSSPDYEEELHDYANRQYHTVFRKSNRYENNILFLYVVDKDGTTFDVIAWVGDDVPSKTNFMLSRDEIREVINENDDINQLSSNISIFIEDLTQEVQSARKPSTKIYTVNNQSDLDVDTKQIEASLQKFADIHGYGVSVVIADYDDVLARKVDWMPILIISAVSAAMAYYLVKRYKPKKHKRHKR